MKTNVPPPEPRRAVALPFVSPIEILESRIAPAAYVIGAIGSLDVHNADGSVFSNTKHSSETVTGADRALLLGKGDTVFFDNDNSLGLSAGDTALVTVSRGSALVFLTDFTDGSNDIMAPSDGRYQPNEITGLAVSNGFRGTINTDVNGAIATALKADGNLDTSPVGGGGSSHRLNIHADSIAALKVSGQVNGDVLAGGSISNFTAGSPVHNDRDQFYFTLSVTGELSTGTATNNETVSFNGGANAFGSPPPGVFLTTGGFVQTAKTAGGSLVNVKLANGAQRIETGNGGDASSGTAGAGGNINGLTMIGSAPSLNLGITLGSGGNSTGSGNVTGGAGGSLLNTSLSFDIAADAEVVGASSGSVAIHTGNGGSGSGTGGGGTGGMISDGFLNLKSTAEQFWSVTVTTGSGGGALTGKAGNGGAILHTVFQIPDDSVSGAFLNITTGIGGVSGTGQGGAGGSFVDDAIFTRVAHPTISLIAGAGATGAKGGVGGSIVDTTVQVLNADVAGIPFGSVNLTAGAGGTSFNGAGAAGGSLTNDTIFVNSQLMGVTAVAGDGGGSFSNAATAGGAGGSITNTAVHLLSNSGAATSELNVHAGAGGNSSNGAGGAGGSLVGDTILAQGGVGSTSLMYGVVNIAAGAGGSGKTAGGVGGALTNDTVQLFGDLFLKNFTSSTDDDGLVIAAGKGGDLSATSATAKAGAGGAIDNLRVIQVGDVTLPSGTSFRVAAGDGGSVVSGAGTQGSGGNGGAITGLNLLHNGTLLGVSSGSGGGGGVFDTFDLDPTPIPFDPTPTPTTGPASLVVVAGNGGLPLSAGVGGAGGSITGAVINGDGAISGNVTLSAGNGAGGISGKGGGGGSIKTSSLAETGTIAGEVLVRAGVGGGSDTTTGGAGGAVDGVFVTLASAAKLGVLAGDAGNSVNAIGGVGGLVNAVTIKTLDEVSEIEVQAGAGGDVVAAAGGSSSAGVGGAAGKISGVTVNNFGGADEINILGAAGGDGHGALATGTGSSGGAGTSVSKILLNNFSALTSASVQSGAGGNAGESGNGGGGGTITGVTANDQAGLASNVTIQGGAGGTGGTVAGKPGLNGGGSGALSTLAFNASDAHVQILGGSGGASTNKNGGAAAKITGVTGLIGKMEIIGGSGGNGGSGSGQSGGAGSSISSVNVAASDFVRLLAAGNGGNGAVAGAGGSVMTVTVEGDIGDFTSPFGVDDNSTGMGGIVAGLGGNASAAKNGSVKTVIADRIAAIIAGRPAAGALTSTNAVFTISGIRADAVGANTGLAGNAQEGAFDFTNNDGVSGFQLGAGDAPVDGLVIARTAGVVSSGATASFKTRAGTAIVTPLKLVKV